MNVTGIRGLPGVRVSMDAERVGLWVQAGENPEARRFVEWHDMVSEGPLLAFPDEVQQWSRNALAYQFGMPTYPMEG